LAQAKNNDNIAKEKIFDLTLKMFPQLMWREMDEIHSSL
jgi:hypothetical protein